MSKSKRVMCGETVHVVVRRSQGKGYNFTRREEHPCYL